MGQLVAADAEVHTADADYQLGGPACLMFLAGVVNAWWLKFSSFRTRLFPVLLNHAERDDVCDCY